MDDKKTMYDRLIVPPKELIDLIQLPINLPEGKRFTVNMASDNGRNVPVFTEIGLIRPADGLPDELSFGCWDSVNGFWNNDKLNRVRALMETSGPSDFSIRATTQRTPPDMTRNDKFDMIAVGIDPAQPELISRTWPYGEGFRTEVVNLGLGKRKEEVHVDLLQVLENLSPDQLSEVEDVSFNCLSKMIVLDHLRVVKRRNRNKPMPNKFIRHKLRQFNKAQ